MIIAFSNALSLILICGVYVGCNHNCSVPAGKWRLYGVARRRCNVMTLHRRWTGFMYTSCPRWVPPVWVMKMSIPLC